MTNLVIDQIHAHRSIRAYKADPVPATMIETIVTAGQRASTSSNLQLTTVIAVREDERRAQLATLCGDQAHIRQAPVFLAWCADLRRLELACEHQGYTQETGYVENFLVAAVDVAIMMQTAALAAEALGLGICYIGGIRNQPQAVIETLGLPRLVFPISGMTLGWPDAEPMLRPRLGLDAVLHWEQYDETGLIGELQAYDQAMMTTGIYHDRQVPSATGPVAVNRYGWLEHTARRVTTCSRTALRAVLARQGFALQ